MSADKSDENTQTAPKCISQSCLPKPKSLGFWLKKASLCVCSQCSVAYKTFLQGTLKFETIMERFFHNDPKVFAA